HFGKVDIRHALAPIDTADPFYQTLQEKVICKNCLSSKIAQINADCSKSMCAKDAHQIDFQTDAAKSMQMIAYKSSLPLVGIRQIIVNQSYLSPSDLIVYVFALLGTFFSFNFHSFKRLHLIKQIF